MFVFLIVNLDKIINILGKSLIKYAGKKSTIRLIRAFVLGTSKFCFFVYFFFFFPAITLPKKILLLLQGRVISSLWDCQKQQLGYLDKFRLCFAHGSQWSHSSHQPLPPFTTHKLFNFPTCFPMYRCHFPGGKCLVVSGGTSWRAPKSSPRGTEPWDTSHTARGAIMKMREKLIFPCWNTDIILHVLTSRVWECIS